MLQALGDMFRRQTREARKRMDTGGRGRGISAGKGEIVRFGNGRATIQLGRAKGEGEVHVGCVWLGPLPLLLST